MSSKNAMSDTPGDKSTKLVRIRRARHGPEDRYMMVDRETPQDGALTYEALGVLMYLLSKPVDWTVQPHNLRRKGAGRDKIYNILNELIERRYMSREIARNQRGVVLGVEYVVYERPLPEKPDTAQPDTANTDITEYREEQSIEPTDNTFKPDANAAADTAQNALEDELDRDGQAAIQAAHNRQIEQAASRLSSKEKETEPPKKSSAKRKVPAFPPPTFELLEALAVFCYGTDKALSANRASLCKVYYDLKKAYRDDPDMDIDMPNLRKAYLYWNEATDNRWRSKGGQRPMPHQITQFWATALVYEGTFNNGNKRAERELLARKQEQSNGGFKGSVPKN